MANGWEIKLKEAGVTLNPSKIAAIEDALDRATVRLGIYTLIANI